jgi:hypothetical protein
MGSGLLWSSRLPEIDLPYRFVDEDGIDRIILSGWVDSDPLTGQAFADKNHTAFQMNLSFGACRQHSPPGSRSASSSLPG